MKGDVLYMGDIQAVATKIDPIMELIKLILANDVEDK